MLGSETAETNLRTMLFACYLQLLGVDVGERDCGDESADDAVTMLFAAVGGRCGVVKKGGPLTCRRTMPPRSPTPPKR